MKVAQNLLYKSFFAVFLLFALYGCQTTDSSVTSGPSVAEPASLKTGSDAEYVESDVLHIRTEENEDSAASVTATDETANEAQRKKELMKTFEKNFIARLTGHGGALSPDVNGKKEVENQDKPVGDFAVKSTDTENRPYIEIEKQLYGKWINKLKTESYDFKDDGTVAIIVSGPRGKSHTLNGNFRIVEVGRIKLDFRNDAIASQMPPRYFKISISENAFSLTDEPKKKGGPDGPTTKYYREE